jgi:hypothetical protein
MCGCYVSVHLLASYGSKYSLTGLKVLTNEKRGGLKVVLFDRSPFKLFSLRFSTKSVQAPSCERPKTTQRTLSLSFEIKNCYPIAVLRRSFMKKSGKLARHVVCNSNIAIDSSPTNQISLQILALFEKIYDGEPILTVVSNIGEDYNTVVSNKCIM